MMSRITSCINSRVFLSIAIWAILTVPVCAQVTLGVVPAPGTSFSTLTQAESFTLHLEEHLGEDVKLRPFEDIKELHDWMVRYRVVDIAVFDQAFFAQQPAGQFRVVAEVFPSQQDESVPPDVMVSRQEVRDDVIQRLQKRLLALGSDPGTRKLLRELGIKKFALPDRRAPETTSTALKPSRPISTQGEQSNQGAVTASTTEAPIEESSLAIPSSATQQELAVETARMNIDISQTAEARHVSLESSQTSSMNLRLAERMALENNLNLKAEMVRTRTSETLVRKGYAVYDTRFEGFWGESRIKNRVNSDFISESPIDTTRFSKYDLSLSRNIPTGAELSVTFNNLRTDSNRTSSLFNPSYNSELKFGFVQPLLKNFGRTVTEQDILYAVKDKEIAIQDLREQAINIITDVRSAYFESLGLKENLAYRQISVELATTILAENQALVEAGALPRIELLEAEVGLAQREEFLIESERMYSDALSRMSLLLNTNDVKDLIQGFLEPSLISAEEEKGFQSALANRSDLQRIRKEIEKLGLELNVAHNQRLPSLDLSANYFHKGLDEDYSNTLNDLASNDLPNWEAGLTLSFPIENRAARNDYLSKGLRLKQKRLLRDQLILEIRHEVQATIRHLDAKRKQMEVAKRRRELAEEKLQILLQRKEVGFTTTRQVLEGEEDLAEGQRDLIIALADLNKVATEYLRVTGLLLEEEGIYLIGSVDPVSEQPLLKMNRN